MKVQYKELKSTYIEIKTLLETTSGEKVKGLNTKIAEDLQLWGDDNYFFLEEFVTKYNLNFNNFEYNKHFESETELFGGLNSFLTILILPFLIIYAILKWIFPNIKSPFDNSQFKSKNKRDDLTFADLIACKLKGEFCLRKNSTFRLQKN